MEILNKRKQVLRSCFSLICHNTKHFNNPPFIPYSLSQNALISKHIYSHFFSIGSRSVCSFYRFETTFYAKIRPFSVFVSESTSLDDYLLKKNSISDSLSNENDGDDNLLKKSSLDGNLLKKTSLDDNLLKKTSLDGQLSKKTRLDGSLSKVTSVDGSLLEDLKNEADRKLVHEIVEAIKNRKDEIVPKGETVSKGLVNEVFRVLNSEKVSGLPFFVWAQVEDLKLYERADFRNLIIDNCGWLGDYDAMRRLLVGFSDQDFCLTEKAFGHFACFGVDRDLAMTGIREIVGVLKEVGGTCRGTGLFGLIKKLCKLDLVEMAMFAVQISDKKVVSYYNVIVQEHCMRSRFEEAHELFEKMRECKCGPDVLSYTYILSALCKNGKTKEACDLLEEMKRKGCKPDALSFELVILDMCKHGKIDIAYHYFGQMVSEGLEPRLSTNAALIKGYFNTEKYGEAHKFVFKLGVEHNSCGTAAYNLLASLHYGKKDVSNAGKLLIEMMDKNFIPHFHLFKNVLKKLHKPEQKQMANDIRARFSKFRNGIGLLPSSKKEKSIGLLMEKRVI